jgi:hypothetical protein
LKTPTQIPLSIFEQPTDNEVITITANLNTSLYLDMGSAGYMPIEFNFNTLEDYNNGLGRYGSAYASEGSVSSTANRKLGFVAVDNFAHSDGTTTMPLDNLGVTVEWTGSNDVDVIAASKALADAEELIIEHDGTNSNAGDDAANSFTVYWEMGTKSGNMNSQSIFEQDLKKGTYTVDVEFILTEVL